MSFINRIKSAYRGLERFAEAVEADPLEELRRRVARLEAHASARSSAPGSNPAPPEG